MKTIPSTVSPIHLIPDIRGLYPSLGGPEIFLDNAGGSQAPKPVIDRICEHFTTSFVQAGADYAASRRVTETIALAHRFARDFVNASSVRGDSGHCILAASSTALLHTLAEAYANAIADGSTGDRCEIVVSTAGHEANIWPWLKLEPRGVTVRQWHARRTGEDTWTLDPETLLPLLNDRTLLVAFPQVSNIFGEVWDAAGITGAAHAAGARVVVDGVACAPHILPDVRSLDADWYVYSTYKVFGPHMACLYGSAEAFAPLTGPNHPFIARDALPSKFEPGGVCHEGAAGLLGSAAYLRALAALANGHTGTPARQELPTRDELVEAFGLIGAIEDALQQPLLAFLADHPRIRVIGERASRPGRLCTISFVVKGASSAGVAKAMNANGFGCRYGNFYSRRLIEQIGLDPADGVVRISLAHYNSPEEVRRTIDALAGVIDSF
jgi:cysteine desulfurase family protein (TIGR01976 family)